MQESEKNRIHVGITGQNGFIGTHLTGRIRVSDTFELIPFHRDFFENEDKCTDFAAKCDVIVHLAALSRHDDGDFLYRTNMHLTEQLIQGVLHSGNDPAILFGSTVQIDKQMPYHASKRDSAQMLTERLPRCRIVNMLMPNVFGAYSKPFYNSVVSTFCYLAAHGRKPEQISDVILHLSEVGELCCRILDLAVQTDDGTVIIPHRYEIRLPELWALLENFSGTSGVPEFKDIFSAELWNVYRSYLAK